MPARQKSVKSLCGLMTGRPFVASQQNSLRCLLWVIIDRFQRGFAMSVYLPEADVGNAGIYEYTP
jgi:hypothetical protein